MGQKDITEKVLADYNDVFADIVNVFVYNGEQVICPSDLENTSVHAQYKAEDGKLHEEERDVTKYWKKENVAIALYGVENQTKVDEYMPFRVIGYDGAAYRSQLLDGREKIAPVTTLVLYFGTENKWNKERSILNLIDIPEGMEEYINDYKIHVFEIAWLTDEQLKMFKSDFGIVANFFVQKRKNKDYIPDDEREIKHVDAVLKLLSVMTGDNRYETILSAGDMGGKVRRMCDVMDRVLNKGLQQGEEAERLRVVKTKLEKGKSVEEIADSLELTVEEVNQLLQLVK